ncbi:uncharacterized protein LOC141633912 [Silene latifolia]|uniref:uncharacterized protein LOC141633912 n=1 Tax=Silene latifolia TaxID=37657 RepID=UPI003D78401F
MGQQVLVLIQMTYAGKTGQVVETLGIQFCFSLPLPDLAQVISLLKENSNYHVPLVVFGHMHKEMLNGGFRNMISIGSDNTIYLNAAIVPRVKPLDLGKSRAFTVVDFMDSRVTKVVETWVLVVGEGTFKEEHILFHADTEVT